MRDRRRSIISFRRTNFPSDITAFARLTFLLPSFFFFLLFLFRRPRGNGRRKKRENSAIFHNDIANLILHWLLLLLPRNTKFFDTLLYSLSLSSSKPAFSISIFSRPKEERNSKISTANVDRPAELNDGGTASSVQMHRVCGYIVLVRARFRFCPSVRSFVPRRYSLPCKTFNGEQERGGGGEKKKDTSVPCEIKPYIYDWGASCAPVREPSSTGGGGYWKRDETAFLAAYINRARLDKTAGEFSRAVKNFFSSPLRETRV